MGTPKTATNTCVVWPDSMNIYGVVILIALLAGHGLYVTSEYLNLRRLKLPPPHSVETLYGGEGIERARSYLRAVTQQSLLERSTALLVLLVFWLSGGFDWLDSLVRQLFAGELVRGLVFVGFVALAYMVVGIPFDVYRTFVTETRFRFNRTTWRTFLADRAKGLALAVVIGGLLLSGVLLLFLHAGGFAWLLCWLTVVAFSLVSQWLGPALILPLFNRFEPMPDGELREAILRYADSVRFPLQNVYVIDGSRRSSRANAYFTGLGRNRRIALFDTLIQQHSTDEIISVLAHEVGHYRLRHVTKGLLLGIAHAGVAFLLLDFFLRQPGLYEAFYVAEPSVYTGLVFFALLYTPIEIALSVFENLLSRRHEFEADRFALQTAPTPGSLRKALERLHVSNLAHPNPHPLHVVLNYTHPPLAYRLQAIDEQVAQSEVP